MGVGAGHHHLAGFQRAAQAIQGLGAEFRQFIQEQHAIVRQADLTGLGLEAAAGQRRHAGRMVRIAERAGAGQLALGDQPGHRMDHRGLKQLFRGQWRQEARQPGGHHRLARSGCADKSQVVPPGRGDLQGPLGVFLTLDLAQVRDTFGLAHGPDDWRREELGSPEVVHQRDQRRRGQDPRLAGPGGLRSASLRTDQPQSHGAGRHGRGQGACDRRDPSVQRKLADRRPVIEHVGWDDVHAGHDRQRDRQVVVTALLGQVRGREIDDDPPARQRKAEAGKGGAHALAAFRDRLVAHADQVESHFATGELRLDIDAPRLHALERHCHHPRGHRSPPRRNCPKT